MRLVWNDRAAVKLALPRPDVAIHVLKWSKLWGWTIRRDAVCLMRGYADTAKLAKQDAEAAWRKLQAGHHVLSLQTYGRRDRRYYSVSCR
jgi:hypothetical protein